MLNTILLHNCTREFVYPIKRNMLEFKLAVSKGESFSISIVYWNNLRKEIAKEATNLGFYASDGEFNHYKVTIALDEAVRYLRYYFRIESGKGIAYLCANGKSNKQPESGFYEYHYTNETDIYEIPEWTKGSVIYQVFPERFCNGDTQNDPKNVEEWGAQPTRENFCGGDIKGIILKLDYLSKLDIDAIYLTPVFKAPSNHKYDTVDYFAIDPSFGSVKDMRELIEQCHKRDIKIVFDGVFNHCGFYFKPFQDLIKNGEKSRYKDWFYVDKLPVETDPTNYECVGYYKWMPKLRHANKKVRKFILDVGEYWIKEFGIDGWRLDVADEVDFTLWQEFRTKVKSINKDAVIIGETWTDGRDLLRGDQMDSIMNYLFRDALIDFIAQNKINAKIFDERIGKMLSIYPTPVHLGLYNLIGSHDTDRFLTLCNTDIRKLKLAVGIQLTFPGMPAIYYGDEIGMQGENDPGCRTGMSWDAQNQELKAFYIKMIKTRKQTKALKLGDFRSVICELEVYGFIREVEDEVVYVVINNDGIKRKINVPTIDSTGTTTYNSLLGNDIYQANQIKDKTEFHNSKMIKYNGFFEIELDGYGLEIIKKEER